MAAVPRKGNSLLSRLKPLLSLKDLFNKSATGGNKTRPLSVKDYDLTMEGEIKVSNWKKMDSRGLGITPKMVPLAPYLVLKILQSKGFEAYLVGGCVRDLILNRAPKDFDVITTADLDQIKKQFHRCVIVGRKFPVCRVHIKDSVIEVSSFKTLAKDSERKEKFLVSQIPRGCDKMDLNLWKNSMHRDFTINCLFYNPLVHKIYDYADGMKDLLDLKLRTLVPAHFSFTEDCARILRGLRIAARLGLSFSKDIEIAIKTHASSISDLSKDRLMLELNYMLSYGAAESSLTVLHRFHLLETLLPFQAAYMSQQATRFGQSSTMLMKLFFHLDKLVTCDQPSDCRLWIGLLAFHMAIVRNPQDPLVVLTFASVLYHQKWQVGLQFARQHGQAPICFEPELSGPNGIMSDDELAKKVNQLANLVVASIDVLIDKDSLHETMANFSSFPDSGLVFISKRMGREAAQIFHVLTHKVKSYKMGRTTFEVDLDLLGKGDSAEARFALGKIILNTIGCGVDQDSKSIKDNYYSPSSFQNEYDMDRNVDKTRLQAEGEEEISKKHGVVLCASDQKKEVDVTKKPEEINGSQSSMKNLICLLKTVTGDEEEDVTEKREKINGSRSSPKHLIYLLKTVIGNEEEKKDKLMEDRKPEAERRAKRKRGRKTKILETSTGNEESPTQMESQKQEDKLVEDTNPEADQLVGEEKRVERKSKRRTKLIKTSSGKEKSPSQSESQRKEDKPLEDTKPEADQLIAEQRVERKRQRMGGYLGTVMKNSKSPSRLEIKKQDEKLMEDLVHKADQLTAGKHNVERKHERVLRYLETVMGKGNSPSQSVSKTQEDKRTEDQLTARKKEVRRKKKKTKEKLMQPLSVLFK